MFSVFHYNRMSNIVYEPAHVGHAIILISWHCIYSSYISDYQSMIKDYPELPYVWNLGGKQRLLL
jgi:hypothetical protein